MLTLPSILQRAARNFLARTSRCEPDEDDQALILYTGTPSGHHRGVCLSHRNIVASALQLSHAMAIGPADIYLHTAPMFNASALKATAITMHGGAHR